MPKNVQPLRDEVFSKSLNQIPEFKFDEQVTQVFEDMIKRSVPGYDLLIYLIGLYAQVFAVENTRIYDLGCSTGVATCMIAKVLDDKDIDVIAIDNSIPMIEQCKKNLKLIGYNNSVDTRVGDIANEAISNTSMVVLNLTLQFIEITERRGILEDIYRGLNDNGILVLSEKVYFEDSKTNLSMIELHQAFKKTQGYSELEISQKRTSIENVLVPESIEQHVERLKSIGFSQVLICFQCLNFVSFLAIK